MKIIFSTATSISIYLLLFFLTSFLVAKFRRNKILFFLSLIFVLLLFGFRYCGTDIKTYESIILRLGSTPLIDILNYQNIFDGIGFQIISHCFYKIGGFTLVNIVIGIFILFPVYIVLYRNRYKINIFLFSFIYLITFFITSFNIMRQFVAVSFIFLGYDYLKNKCIIKYFICIIIGFLFHSTAIIGISFWMINVIVENKNKNTKYGYLKVLGACLLIVTITFFSIKYVSIASYSGYLENTNSGKNRDFIVILFKFFILIVLKNRLVKIDDDARYYILFCLITLLIGTTGFMSAYIKRLYYYFNIFECFSFALIPKLFKQKRLISNGIVVFYIGLFILTTLIIPQGHVVPLILKIGS